MTFPSAANDEVRCVVSRIHPPLPQFQDNAHREMVAGIVRLESRQLDFRRFVAIHIVSTLRNWHPIGIAYRSTWNWRVRNT